MDERSGDGYWRRLRQGRVGRRRALAGGATFLTGGFALGLVGCGGSNNKAANVATQAAAQATSATRAAAASATATAASSPAARGATPAGSPAASAATTPVQAGNFKTGGTIQGFILGTANLDPVANTTYRSQQLAGFHYSRLFRFDSGADPLVTLSRNPVPDLVSGYEITDGGLTFNMKLRQGVNFHPPLSRPLTSADVLASYQYFTTNPGNSNSTVFAPIVDSLTAPDDNTIVFKLKQPYAPFLNKLANSQYLWMLSKDAVGGKIDPAKQAVGTGPWIYVSTDATAFTWKKNPDYFIKGIPYADGAVLNVIPDTSTQEAQFEAGKIDILNGGYPPIADVPDLLKSAPKTQTFEFATVGLSFFFFSNVTDPNSPFKDPRMRQAASLAVDRKTIIDSVWIRGVYDDIVPPGLGKWWLDPNGANIGDGGKWFKFDPQQAKQLIAAAGHADTELKFVYPNNAYGDLYNTSADAIRGMLTDAGFKITVVNVDYLKDYINNGQGIFNKGAPPNSIVYALESAFSDPDDYLTGMLTKGGNRNHDLLDDPALAAAVQKQQTELDENKRLQLVYDVQKLHANLMYYPPLTYPKYVNVAQPWVKNYFPVDDYNVGTEEFAYVSVNNK